jgi:DNA polymerase I domain protein
LTQNVVSDDYLRGEHAKMQRITVVEEEGVRIDLDALGDMVAEEEATKNDIRTWLVDTVGIPDIGKAPWSTTVGKQAISRNVQY